jgi:ribosomal protein L40E
MPKKARFQELISCHDCGGRMSFSAAACPHCGSTEPRGPYIHSRSELRRFRAEERNDRTLAISVLACGAAGAFYGVAIASTTLWKALLGTGYGCLGLLVGVPVAFIINMTRHVGR